jgi:heme exporter protein B
MQSSFWLEVWALAKKEATLEWRSKYAFNGLLLYITGAIFVCYLAFNLQLPDPITWNALFWVLMLFAAINGISKSFQQEKDSRYYFYYQLARPEAIIVAKMFYNAGLMLLVSLMGIAIFSLVLGNPVQDQPLFLASLCLAAISFSTTLTMISGIAAKASSSGTLMAVLGFPVVLPLLLLIVKISKNATDGLARSVSSDEFFTIFAINLIVTTASYILFPYLWRS